jgi:NAD(P)-dependent dehydrogenase (short-subunit alcohol dehydrogenase family)
MNTKPAMTSPYYSSAVWGIFSTIATVYSLISHATLGLLYPCGTRIQKSLPSLPNPTPDDIGLVAIITGCNTGIGLETTRGLVKRGYTVILACRSREKAMEATADISGPGKVDFVHPLDLSAFDSVKDFAEAVRHKYNHIDLLINNAGRNTSGRSEKYLDLCFQTNFLGHFLLTQQLIPLLMKAKEGRIVNLASVMHHFCRDSISHDYQYWIDCARYHTEPRSTYSPSKLAAILFTVELRKRYPKLSTIAVNPGSVNSDIWRTFPRFVIPLFRLVFLDTVQGSTCSLAASLLPSTDLPLYLQPYWIPFSKDSAPHPIFEMLGLFAGYAPTSPRLPSDGGFFEASSLWKASEELTQCKFPVATEFHQ